MLRLFRCDTYIGWSKDKEDWKIINLAIIFMSTQGGQPLEKLEVFICPKYVDGNLEMMLKKPNSMQRESAHLGLRKRPISD